MTGRMKVHLIGICGTGMGSLAGLLKAAGHDVRGSDEHVYPPMSTQLAELGIPCVRGLRAANLDWEPDAVVVGNVCRKDHVEVLAAQERNIPLESFPALFGKLFLRRGNARSIVVAGTHGKTTTSSLLALRADRRRARSVVPGRRRAARTSGGRGGSGTGAEFVVEGDEYDTAFFDKGSKFLHYRPRHRRFSRRSSSTTPTSSGDEEAVTTRSAKFVALIPEDGLLVACAASPGAMEVARGARSQVVTYGRPGSGADWTFEVGGARARRAHDAARGACEASAWSTVDTSLPGIYNLENLVGVIARRLRPRRRAARDRRAPCAASWACAAARRCAASRTA